MNINFFFGFAWVLFNFYWHLHRFILNNTHSAEILRQYRRNIPWKDWKNAKIFQNLSLILLKYFNNVAMSAQNMTYAIFSKYCQTNKCINHPHSIEYCSNMSEIFPIFYCNCNIFVNYSKILHCKIIILTFWNIFVNKWIFNTVRNNVDRFR